MEPPNLGLRCIGLSQYNIGFWRTTLVYNSIELVCGSLTLVYDSKTFVYDCRISSGSLFSEQLVHLIFTRYSWVRIRGKSLVFQKGATTADCLRTVCRHILAIVCALKVANWAGRHVCNVCHESCCETLASMLIYQHRHTKLLISIIF